MGRKFKRTYLGAAALLVEVVAAAAVEEALTEVARVVV